MNTDLAKSRAFVLTLGSMTAAAALTIDLSLPAIPSMVEAMSTTLSRAQQIVGVFMIGMAFGQIPAGLASDRFGRMPALLAGLGLFSLAATVAMFAQSIEVMLAARFVQGTGASAAIVIARAIVRDISSGREMARLMSLMTMIFTVAPVIAPSIGALLVTQWGWRSTFVGIAICGYLTIIAAFVNLRETHAPDTADHPARQLARSFREFFNHRQSVFAFLLLIFPMPGTISLVAVSAALTVEVYGYSIQQYGLIFATVGLSILTGSVVNRWLVARFDPIQLLSIGVPIVFVASLQLALMAWMNSAPFAWLWTCFCLFAFANAIVMPNAAVVALDPLPRIAGVASSIIGTAQNLTSAAGAIIASAIFDGSVRNALLVISASGLIVVLVFVMRPLICPGEIRADEHTIERD